MARGNRITLIATLAALALILSFATHAQNAGLAHERGLAAYREGQFEQALREWRAAEEGYAPGSAERSRAMAQRGLALQALGRHGEALEALRGAAGADSKVCSEAIEPRLLDALGGSLLLAGLPQPARRCLALARDAAETTGDRALLAVVLNNVGLLNELQEQHDDALAAYRRSIVLADEARAARVGVKARVNLALLMGQGELGDTVAAWRDAYAYVERLPASYDKIMLLIALGAIPEPQLAGDAREACERAGQLARERRDRRQEAAASDCGAALHERSGRPSEALRLARQALALARRAQAPDLEFVIEGRIARVLRKLGRDEDAVPVLRSALATVERIRGDLAIAHRARHTSFRESVEPLYTGLADLLLARAGARQGKDAAVLLTETRTVLERLKAAELRDFFQDDCVDALRVRKQAVERVSATSAVIYTVVLQERTEILVSFPDGEIVQHTVRVPRRALAERARELRYAAGDPAGGDHLAPAQQLNAWLIAGVEPILRERRIDTLAFVPDGPLRGVPLAALHDGKRFLVERYAIATIPGLELVESQPLVLARAEPLLAGVSIAVAGFPALPYVKQELNEVHAVAGGRTLTEFTAGDIERELRFRAHRIVHIASHGSFTGDPARSFLVTAEGELKLERIQRLMRAAAFTDRPIELIVLSACETATGDERAALGMAGLTVQAGARSALASLWQVNDAATADLMKGFYTELKHPGTSKAQALQRAQVAFLANPTARYRHPFFWAPFVLVGNWQ